MGRITVNNSHKLPRKPLTTALPPLKGWPTAAVMDQENPQDMEEDPDPKDQKAASTGTQISISKLRSPTVILWVAGTRRSSQRLQKLRNLSFNRNIHLRGNKSEQETNLNQNKDHQIINIMAVTHQHMDKFYHLLPVLANRNHLKTLCHKSHWLEEPKPLRLLATHWVNLPIHSKVHIGATATTLHLQDQALQPIGVPSGKRAAKLQGRQDLSILSLMLIQRNQAQEF